VPHLLYHANHLDLYDTGDQVANLVALGATVVLPAILLLGTIRGTPDVSANNWNHGVQPVSHETRSGGN
jgi:hypothetical protein